jgi:hypothetical protein
MSSADLLWPPEIKSYEDLLPPGAKEGTVPTDIEQATGLERLEILGKMQGIDIFDMKPLDASRVGTLELWEKRHSQRRRIADAWRRYSRGPHHGQQRW